MIRAYESSLRNHVLPDLGGKKLAKLERRDVQALVERLTEKVGPSAVRNAVKPLQTICRRAVEDGDLAISPCEHLRLPAAPDRRERIASPAEAASLIAALGQQDRALWACAFYAGLRMGEIRALRWDDVDHAHGVIRVERAMDNSGVLITPKSRAGRRRVPIVRQLWDELVLHQLATNRDRGLVFGTTPVEPVHAERRQPARAERPGHDANLTPIGLHEARHTYASLMIAAGANAKTISRLHGPLLDPGHVRPLRPPDARKRGRSGRHARGVSDPAPALQGKSRGSLHPENPDNRGRPRTTESNAETRHEQGISADEEVGPAGFEPATQSFEGSCSVP